MSPRRRELLTGYARSLALSVGMSIPIGFLFNMRVHPLVGAALFGFTFGTGFFAMGNFLLPRLRSRSFVATILKQAALFYLTIALCMSTSLWAVVMIAARQGPFGSDVVPTMRVILTNSTLLASSLGAFLIAVVITLFFQFSRKLGPGVLWNWMTGKYHEPREEHRVFMFLDMKDSTTLAEQLGNLKFSALVRDFFEDLSEPILATRGEISHYVGDEAVISWPIQRGLENGACIECFFLMEQAIEKRRGRYLERYGLVPGFKAGLHAGPVVATEVGEIKSEIVYHGDVLNAAARIQGLCNELNEKLLISDDLAAALPPDSYQSVELGERELRGKVERIGIVAIRKEAPA